MSIQFLSTYWLFHTFSIPNKQSVLVWGTDMTPFGWLGRKTSTQSNKSDNPSLIGCRPEQIVLTQILYQRMLHMIRVCMVCHSTGSHILPCLPTKENRLSHTILQMYFQQKLVLPIHSLKRLKGGESIWWQFWDFFLFLHKPYDSLRCF